MDTLAAELRRPSPTAKRLDWRSLATLMGAVFAVMAASRLLFHVHKPMLAVSAGLFLLCCAVFALRVRRRRHQRRHFLVLILTWIGISIFVFGMAFHLDRSRWLYYELTGYDVCASDELFHLTDATVRSFLAYNRHFVPDPTDPEHIILPMGTYVVDRTLVVPRGTHLTIEPGTTIRFEHGRSLISYSPIEARGTASQPIRFESRHRWRKWGVLGILGEGHSVFEHARFENGRNARVNGVDFFGTLSLIGANVEIRHSNFEHLVGKDAVYVRGGQVSIHENHFEDVRKDGLDLDGGSGEVSHNRFIDCRDEGIDLSQTGDVDVFDNVILDARGGRIGTDRDLEFLKAKNSLGYTRGH